MINNKKRKGFTIVELVIVIAVIAILAGVLIPTFASIINRANQSADIQAVRQMNMALLAESVENKPEGIENVIDIVAEIGYDSAEKRTPASSNHGFFWHSGTNLIILVKNSTELIFPEDNAELNAIFAVKDFTVTGNDTFYNLKDHEGTGGSGGITDPAKLKEALEAGGTVQLGGHITINEAITIPSGTTTTLDLNGQQLTLSGGNITDSPVVSVLGALTIKDSVGTGNVVVQSDNTDTGICVGDPYAEETTGTLTLNNVNIEGSDMWIIANYGTAELTNSKFTVGGGFGFANAGAATISGCDFEATELSTTILYALGGSMNISSTEFSAAQSVTSYNAIADYSYGAGEFVLRDVTTKNCGVINTSGKTEIYGGEFDGSVTGKPLVIKANEAGEFGKFLSDVTFGGTGNEIGGGTFEGQLKFLTNSETTITSGTFNGGLSCTGSNNRYTEVTINGGEFSGTLEFKDWSDVEINGGTFNSVLTLKRSPMASINIYIKYGTTFGETTLSATTDDSAVYTVPSGSSTNSVTKGTDGWTINKP